MNNSSSLIIGILGCAKYPQRHDGVRRSWLKDCSRLGLRACFLVGRPDKKPAIEGDILYLDCGDDYLDLPHKTIAFLRFVDEHMDYSHIYKCDDDTYVNVPELLKLPFDALDYAGFQYKDMDHVDTKWHKKHVGSHLKNVAYPGVFYGPWMMGGSGYFLSKKALRCVINDHGQYIDKELYEDKLIGDTLRGKGMSVSVLLSLKEKFTLNRHFVREIFFAASFHPCSPSEMDWLQGRNNVFFTMMLILKYALNLLSNIMRSIFFTLCGRRGR